MDGRDLDRRPPRVVGREVAPPGLGPTPPLLGEDSTSWRCATGPATCRWWFAGGGVPAETLDAAPPSSRSRAAWRCAATVGAHPRRPGVVEVAAGGPRRSRATAAEWPLGKKDHGPGFLLDHRHLWLRGRRPAAVLRVRAEIVKALRRHLDERGFVGVDAPILHRPRPPRGRRPSSRSEYFDQTVFLSQTGQLHMEAAAQALGRVYCFGPTFRAEKSKTRRHLTEFWMLEPEIAFASLDEVMDLMESLRRGASLERVLDRCRAELEVLERDVSAPRAGPRPALPADVLRRGRSTGSRGATAAVRLGRGLRCAAGGRALARATTRRSSSTASRPAIKAFYMRPDPARPEVALGCDLIAPEGYGEIIGGGERSPDLAVLERRIARGGAPTEAYEWYLDLRRYGACPSAGFGLGLERVVAWICGLEHVREAIAFPRPDLPHEPLIGRRPPAGRPGAAARRGPGAPRPRPGRRRRSGEPSAIDGRQHVLHLLREVGQVVEDVGDEGVAHEPSGLGLEGGQQAVAEGREEGPGEVLRVHVAPARAQRGDPRHPADRLAPPGLAPRRSERRAASVRLRARRETWRGPSARPGGGGVRGWPRVRTSAISARRSSAAQHRAGEARAPGGPSARGS